MGSRVTIRQSLTAGLIGAVLMLYLSAVGLVEAFAEREAVAGYLTIGRLMLIIPPLAMGYLASRGSVVVGGRLGLGALAGATAGLLFSAGLLVALYLSPDLRSVLVRISPALLDFLSFGTEPLTAALYNIGIAGLLGVAGAAVHVASPLVRRVLVAGFGGALLISMTERFVRPRLTEFDLKGVVDFLFKSNGLTLEGAIAAFVVSAAIAVAWRPARTRIRAQISKADAGTQGLIRWVSLVVLIAFLLALPQITGVFISQVLVLVGLYVLLGLGLNIVVGYAGLLDLGYVAFYAVGAYFTALLTSPTSSLGFGLSFWVALPIVIVGSAVVGLLIGAPVLRLRGDYLAIVTLGFGEIARLLFLSDAMKPWFGGVQGILAIPDMIEGGVYSLPILGEISGPAATYYPLLIFCLVAAFVASRLKYSRTGRAWNAMREDEDVAQATGINVTNYKLLAFAMGASVGCLGGAIFVTHLESVFPGSFDVLVSITVLAVVVLGGMGSIPGVIVGALALIGLPELLREFAEFRLLVYGGVLVLMMLLRPEGLVPDASRRQELHEGAGDDERAGDPAPASGATITPAGAGSA